MSRHERYGVDAPIPLDLDESASGCAVLTGSQTLTRALNGKLNADVDERRACGIEAVHHVFAVVPLGVKGFPSLRRRTFPVTRFLGRRIQNAQDRAPMRLGCHSLMVNNHAGFIVTVQVLLGW
jgi:hypothetical protein